MAAPFQARTKLPLTELPGLAEIGPGAYEGRADEQARDSYHGALAAWMDGDLGARVPGSISGRQFLDRFDGAIDSILEAGLSAAAAFTHGAAIRAWVGIRAQNLDRSFMEARPVRNTAISG